MTLSGYDSAFGPSLATAVRAKAEGASFWFGYIGGLGAYRSWTQAEWDIIREAGLIPGCLWVPTYGMGEDPVAAASEAIERAIAVGLYGAVMLDTEYQMRADGARLRYWVDTFCATVTDEGRAAPVYAGGNYVAPSQSGFMPLWGSSITPGPASAIQYGPNVAGVLGLAADSVDVDLCGSMFPLASFTPQKPPAPPAPPTPTPVPPKPVKEDDMVIFTCPNQPDILAAGGIKFQLDQTSLVNAIAAGAVPLPLSPFSYAQMTAAAG